MAAPLTPIQIRQNLFDTMVIRKDIVDQKGKVLVSNIEGKVKAIVNKIIANRSRYENVSWKFPNPIRWYHVGIIHYLECSLNFNCYLGNGQPFNKKTTIVPKNRGPFKTWEEGAIDAIKLEGLDKVKDWSIGNTLYILEGFNGYGYSLYKGTNSPYVFSRSNHYTKGKYVADGRYDANAVSQQIGVALLLKELIDSTYL